MLVVGVVKGAYPMTMMMMMMIDEMIFPLMMRMMKRFVMVVLVSP